MRAIHAIILCIHMLTACGGASPRPAAESEAPAGEEPQESGRTPAGEDPQDGQTPAVVAASDEPVSWAFFEPMSIDRDGVVTMGGRVLGTLSDGRLVGSDGALLASVGADGYVSFEGEQTRTRISGLEVREVSDDGGADPVLRIEGDVLVIGTGRERMPVENLTPARTADVLLVSTFAVHAMAGAFRH
jgi:hypothetical protein